MLAIFGEEKKLFYEETLLIRKYYSRNIVTFTLLAIVYIQWFTTLDQCAFA